LSNERAFKILINRKKRTKKKQADYFDKDYWETGKYTLGYETLNVIRPEMTMLANALEEYSAPEPILVLGCGKGYLKDLLSDKDLEVIGEDISRWVLGTHKDKGNIFRGDAEKLPVKRNSIGTIISLDLLDHLLKPQDNIREMNMILRSKGWVFLKVNNVFDIGDTTHVQGFTEAGWVGLLELYGFKLIQRLTPEAITTLFLTKVTTVDYYLDEIIEEQKIYYRKRRE